MNRYDTSVESCFDDIEIYCRMGGLAMNWEEGSLSLGNQELKGGGI